MGHGYGLSGSPGILTEQASCQEHNTNTTVSSKPTDTSSLPYKIKIKFQNLESWGINTTSRTIILPR